MQKQWIVWYLVDVEEVDDDVNVLGVERGDPLRALVPVVHVLQWVSVERQSRHLRDGAPITVVLPDKNKRSQSGHQLREYLLWVTVRGYSCVTSALTFLFPASKRICGKRRFSQVSVCSQRGPMWPLPMMHWTSLYRARPLIPNLGPTPVPLLLTSGGHQWRPVKTCSFEDLSHQYWHLVVCTWIQKVLSVSFSRGWLLGHLQRDMIRVSGMRPLYTSATSLKTTLTKKYSLRKRFYLVTRARKPKSFSLAPGSWPCSELLCAAPNFALKYGVPGNLFFLS